MKTTTQTNEKVVVNLKDFQGAAHDILVNGISAYSNKTEADYIAEGFTVMTWDEYKAVTNKYDDGLCGQWREIGEEVFNYALNSLPPIRYSNGGFFFGEMYMHDVTAYYQEWHGKYYTAFQRLSYKSEDIIASLERYIQGGKGHE